MNEPETVTQGLPARPPSAPVVAVDYGPEERYRLYAVPPSGALILLAACPDAASIGTAIITLHEDAQERGQGFADYGRFGLLDGLTHEWIVLPWARAS